MKLVEYERAIALRDLRVLQNNAMGDDDPKVTQLLQAYAPGLAVKHKLSQTQLAALRNNPSTMRQMCAGLCQDTIAAADEGLKQLMAYRLGINDPAKAENADNSNKSNNNCSVA